MQQVNLSSENFSTLLRCLSIFKDVCSDIDIRNGIIRQRTNDKFSVFEIDMSSLIGNINIIISNLKQKMELFKIFMDTDVALTSYDTYHILSDEYSSIRFENPSPDYIDNKYMEQGDLENIIATNPDDIILSTDLSESITNRMRIITAVFNVNSVKVIFNENNADISVTTQSKDQHAKIVSNITTEKVIKCNTDIINTPFTIDHDGDIKLTMYANLTNDNSIASTVTSSKLDNLDVMIYTRSNLVFEEE